MDEKDPYQLLQLRSLNATANRSYFIYEILEKLLQSQKRSLLDEIAVPIGLAASVLSVFGFLESPPSRNLILIAYAAALAIIVVAPVAQRRLSKSGLDDVVYLGIYLDEVSKYVGEIKFAKKFSQTDSMVSDFVRDTTDALAGARPFVYRKIAKLQQNGVYPDCLVDIGRSKEWVGELDVSVKSVLGKGLFEDGASKPRKPGEQAGPTPTAIR